MPIFNKHFFTALILLSMLMAIIACLLLPLFKFLGQYQRFYVVSVLIIIFGIWFNNLISVYQADLRSISFTVYTIINNLLKFLVALFIIVFLSKDIIYLLWAIILSFLITDIPMILMIESSREKKLKENNENIRPVSFSQFFKEFFTYGFPMIGWFLGAQILSISGRYILQIFRNSEEVGIYSSNYNLAASAILLVSMPLLTAAHPLLMIAGTKIDENKEKVQNIITLFSRYFLLFALPIMAYVLMFSKEISDVFLGFEYRKGHMIISIVLLGLLVWNFAMFGHKGMEYRKKTNTMFVFVLLCAVINIIFNIILIPHYGYMGATIATLIGFISYPIFIYFGTKGDIKWNLPWFSLIKTLSASFILCLIYFIIKICRFHPLITLVLGVAITLPIYFFLLFVLKEFKHAELTIMKKIFVNLEQSNNIK